MSERITWTTCPHCAEAAAVGWLRGVPVEFDCTAGCRLTNMQILHWMTDLTSSRAEREQTIPLR
jgi:hypothetical protein